MKILLITNATYGGAGKACFRLYNALRDAGTEVRMLYLDGRNHHDPNVVPYFERKRDVFLHQLISRPRTRLASLILGDRREQYRLPTSTYRVEDHPLVAWADVINLHWVPDFINYPRFFSKIGAKPVVWTMHDMLPFSGGFAWERDVQRRDAEVEARITATKTRALRNARLSVVAPSQWLCDVSHRHQPFAGRTHRRVFNCVPTNIYKPIVKGTARDILGLPKEGKLLLFAADNVESRRKGMTYLTEALDGMHRKNMALVSVGRGRLPMSGSFDYHHIGSLHDEVSLALCYSAADLVVVPSIMDNSPNIIVESFACGTPAVAFDVGGIGELISNPEVGIMVSEANSRLLAEGIDQAMATSFSTEAVREHALANFSPALCASNYIDTYEATFRQ